MQDLLSEANCPECTRDVFQWCLPNSNAPWVLVCEHASNFIPPEYKNLGLGHEMLSKHIAWDIGALAVAKLLSDTLQASLICHLVSRLVYDCNREPGVSSAIPDRSERFHIPGNSDLSDEEVLIRQKAFYDPFCFQLNQRIDQKIALNQTPILITIHSFTPIYDGNKREVEIGILHNKDATFADLLLAELQRSDFIVRRNSPYGPENPEVMHTIDKHGAAKKIPHVMIEINNGLIDNSEGQEKIASLLACSIQNIYRQSAEVSFD